MHTTCSHTQTWGQFTVSISLTAPFGKLDDLERPSMDRTQKPLIKKPEAFLLSARWQPEPNEFQAALHHPQPKDIPGNMKSNRWSGCSTSAVSVNLFTTAIKFTSTEIHHSSIYHVCNRDAFIVFTHPVVLPYLTAVRTRPFMLLAQFCYLTLSKPKTTCMCRSISCTSIFIRSLASSQIHWACLWRYTCTQKSEQYIQYTVYVYREGWWLVYTLMIWFSK